MADHELRVLVHPEVRRAFASQEHRITGGYDDGLPEQVSSFSDRIDAWAELVRGHHAIADPIDLAQGWRSEDARIAFLDEARSLESDLKITLGSAWSVDVSPEPGVSVVRLMGEYSSEWPLWIWEGGTGSEDWPMLSDQMHLRLKAWAIEAEPDLRNHNSGPEPHVTEHLARDLRRELGPRFILKVLD